ncbi:peptidoglycan-binding domain-containing protein [Streptomyces melanogenes]|uniref:Peptidoglycan-binding protein n=1 Tax=Streptomyces melanogenes TaxID=67326 RepID=A0ABZ1XUX9_9ACTN|nr:peptidoglycan-binding domain-containing protein [Streptomyces melanogenes]
MRPALAKALVTSTAVIGLAAATLTGASTSFAASPPAAHPAVATQDSSVLAVNNLGLNTARAKNWQCWLRTLGQNPGTIDGQLGSNSWKAAQREFGFTGSDVDGIVGPKTIKGLQNHLNYWGGYHLAVDGQAGSATRAAFWEFNGTGC